VSTQRENVPASGEPTRLEAAVRVGDVLFTAALGTGAFAAVLGWTPGVVLLLAGFAGHLAGHVALGVAGYRRVMRRPWPPVRPLADDDDW
jgi:hypothetical protein